MSERTQHNLSAPLALLTMLLIVAVAVYLLATLAGWAFNLPVPPALAVAQDVPPAAPTPAAVTGSPSLLATPEPTATPAMATPSPTPTSTPAPLLYTVQEGDTLGSIAQAHAVSVEDLAAANSLANPNLLYVGQTLIVPGGSPVATPPSLGPDLAQPTPIPSPALPSTVNEERWIDVDLTQQSLTAYEGHTPVHTTLVSTGLPNTPTPVGQFRIWIKLRYDDMSGPGYYIEDVPYVMYFYEGYGLHGVTWHGNFGHPMSHGCVNLPTSEAEWLFQWADVGTLVNVHN